MITVPQIKAARALLGWTQKELAKVSGISLAAIAQIESGAGNPRVVTMTIIQKAFEKYGIEFSDDPGVRIQQEPFDVTVWQGKEAIDNLWNDIEETLSNGGTLSVSAVQHSIWEGFFPGKVEYIYERRRKKNIMTRGLFSRKEDNTAWPPEACRLVPLEALNTHTPHYIYADKVALVKLTDPLRVVLIRNPTLAESFLKQFQYLWDTGKKF